ncbi:MAG: hypothetical protein K9J81_03185 [Desulfohalobiaceae bacterium]|nr:hypothetical protein [Desulfohalobiaceae bacterium]
MTMAVSFPKGPKRIGDLIEAREKGAEVVCTPSFEIVPTDFSHAKAHFQAYIFLCRYKGSIDGQEFHFRKCYARGCPHNLCPHVSQAVLIANRYLQKDYQLFRNAGIVVEEKLFSLEEMLVQYAEARDEYDPSMTIHDYIDMAQAGADVVVSVELEYVPAVEHFANEQSPQTFLMGHFTVQTGGKTDHCQHCFACYPTTREKEEKAGMQQVANERLHALYQEFEQASISCEAGYFF